MSTIVIVEPGCTAEGDYHAYLKLIDVAADCGADVFKPQWTSNPERMVLRRKVPVHPYWRYYNWLNFPIEWHEAFKAKAKARGMQYACSVYLPEDVGTIAPLVDYLKISAFEAEDDSMRAKVERYVDTEKPRLVVSFGRKQDPGRRWGWGGDAVCLHTVQAYPAPLKSMNLAYLRQDDEHVPWFRGLSDHSRHVLTGAVAVGAGAEFVEVHYRLPYCDPKNPDYAVAFDPDGLSMYISNVRTAETMMFSGDKDTTLGCEEAMARYRVDAHVNIPFPKEDIGGIARRGL